MKLPQLSLVAALLGAVTMALPAQEQSSPVQFATLRATKVTASGPDLPAPPRSVNDLPGHGPMPTIPEGPRGLPQQDVPPVQVGSADTANANVAANDFRLFSVRTVGGGGTRSNVGEPSVAIANNGTAAFATGNSFASHSANAGASWSTVNPYTRFPASDGGFCCDQRVLSTPSGSTFWYLQYRRNGSGNNRARVAVSKTASDLQANRWAHYYDFTAQTFGFASGHWLDFPDIASTPTNIWFTSNVFRSGTYVDSVVWTVQTAQLVAGGNIGIGFGKSTSMGGGASYRLTQGAGSRMYWAAHRNTTQMILYWDNNNGGFSWQTKTISRWSSANIVVRDRSGNNWAERADSRMTGGFFAGDRFGFAWHSAPVTGRPDVHIRLVAFNASNRALNLDTQVWSPGWHHLYPACAGNADGSIGIKMALGQNGDFPRAGASLHDDIGHSGVLYYASSTSSPGAAWGDYFTANRHNNLQLQNTFYGSGLARIGDERSYLVHYGREAYRSGFVGLRVLSNPRGARITSSADRFNSTVGAAPYFRSYARNARFTVTAPLTHAVGSTVYAFQRWRTRAAPGNVWRNQPVGRLAFTLLSIGAQADSAEAVYVRRRRLTIQSTKPTSGTTITVAPTDISGNGSGRTTRTLYYRDAETVTLTAPSVAGINPFRRWVLNGAPQSAGNRTLRVTMSRDNVAVAQYRVRVHGSYASYGRGCPGTGNLVPLHVGSGTPEIGNTLVWHVARARRNLSGRIWLGARQSIPLRSFGMPGCIWYASRVASFPIATDGAGNARYSLPIRTERSWIGANLYTQALLLDPGAPTSTKIVWTNGLQTMIGGVR